MVDELLDGLPTDWEISFLESIAAKLFALYQKRNDMEPDYCDATTADLYQRGQAE